MCEIPKPKTRAHAVWLTAPLNPVDINHSIPVSASAEAEGDRWICRR